MRRMNVLYFHYSSLLRWCQIHIFTKATHLPEQQEVVYYFPSFTSALRLCVYTCVYGYVCVSG